jgi:hypothetical protein
MLTRWSLMSGQLDVVRDAGCRKNVSLPTAQAVGVALLRTLHCRLQKPSPLLGIPPGGRKGESPAQSAIEMQW